MKNSTKKKIIDIVAKIIGYKQPEPPAPPIDESKYEFTKLSVDRKIDFDHCFTYQRNIENELTVLVTNQIRVAGFVEIHERNTLNGILYTGQIIIATPKIEGTTEPSSSTDKADRLSETLRNQRYNIPRQKKP